MNIKKAFTTACLATAGLMLIGQSAHASLSYTDGDLFLGFRQTGATNDYLLDLGQPDLFVNATPGSTIVLNTTISGFGDIGADLSSASVFGSNWYTAGNVYFAVVGGNQLGLNNDPSVNTLYSTNPSETPWTPKSDLVQGSTTTKIGSLGAHYVLGTSTANSDLGEIQLASAQNSYAYFQPNGQGSISFGTWNPTNEGLVGTTLYLNQIVANDDGNTSINLGTIDVASDGTVTFTAAGAVPEPSTYALLGAGAAFVGFLVYRRNRALKA